MTLQIFKNITILASRLGIYTVKELEEYKKQNNVENTKDFIRVLINDVENESKGNFAS